MQKKKIVYLTSNMGSGHRMTAISIRDAIEAYYPKKYDHEIMDVLSMALPTMEKIAGSLYEASVKYSKPSYKAWFNITDKSNLLSGFDKSNYRAFKKNLEPIADAKPDLVVSCFPFASYSAEQLLKDHGIKAPLVSTITDTGEVHSAWVSKSVDTFLAPTNETAFFLEQRGISPEKVQKLGFPVRQMFYEKYDKEKLRKKYEIDEGKKVVLYFSGAWGFGPVKDKIKAIDAAIEDCVIVIICGKNEKLAKYFKSSRLHHHNRKVVLGYVDYVAELMALADLVVTKAGGISVMETVTMKKPILISEIVPGQEEPNARFIESMGFGYTETDADELGERAKFMLLPEEQERINQNYANYKLNDGADKRIADYLVKKYL